MHSPAQPPCCSHFADSADGGAFAGPCDRVVEVKDYGIGARRADLVVETLRPVAGNKQE